MARNPYDYEYGGATVGQSPAPSPTGTNPYDYTYSGAAPQEEPSLLMKALHTVGSVAGYPKSLVDRGARAVLRAEGIPTQDTDTTGSMLRAGFGYDPNEAPTTGGRLIGKAIEFGGDIASDPLTPLFWGAGAATGPGAKAAQMIAKGAGVGFTGLMGVGAVEEGKRAYDTYQQQGLSPEFAESALGTALSAGGAGLGLKHAFAKETMLQRALRERDPRVPSIDLELMRDRAASDQAMAEIQQRAEARRAAQAESATLEAQGTATQRQAAADAFAEREALANEGIARATQDASAQFPQRDMAADLQQYQADRLAPIAEELVRPRIISEGIDPALSRPHSDPIEQIAEQFGVSPEEVARLQPIVEELLKRRQRIVEPQAAGTTPQELAAIREPAPRVPSEAEVLADQGLPSERQRQAAATAQAVEPAADAAARQASDARQAMQQRLVPVARGLAETPSRVVESSPIETTPRAPEQLKLKVPEEPPAQAAPGPAPAEPVAGPEIAIAPGKPAAPPKVAWNTSPEILRKESAHGYAMVEVPTADLLSHAKADIERPGRAQETKLTRAKSFLQEADSVETPEIDFKNGKLIIEDGYHRTQAAANAGVENVPVRIPRAQLAVLRKLGVPYRDLLTGAKHERAGSSGALEGLGGTGRGVRGPEGGPPEARNAGVAQAPRGSVDASPRGVRAGEEGPSPELTQRIKYLTERGHSPAVISENLGIPEGAVRSALAEKRYAAGELGPSRPLKIEDVHRTFRGLKFEPEGDSFVSRLPNGREVRINRVGEIQITDPITESAAASGHAEPKAVGDYQTVGQKSTINIADGAPEGTIDHEAFHLFWELALSDREKISALKKYGSEEGAAYAYPKWAKVRGAQTNSWFTKIMALARRVAHIFRPTWESTFERIESGRASKQLLSGKEPTRLAPAGRRFAAADSPQKASLRGFASRFFDQYETELKDNPTGVRESFLGAVASRFGSKPQQERAALRAAAEELATEELNRVRAPRDPDAYVSDAADVGELQLADEAQGQRARKKYAVAAAVEEEPLGRTMTPDEAPRVETRVEDYETAKAQLSPEQQKKLRPLARDAPRTWESLDPTIRDEIGRVTTDPKKEAAFFQKFATGRVSDVDVQVMDALVAGRKEAREGALARMRKAEKDGFSPEASKQYLMAAIDSVTADLAKVAGTQVQGHTKLARALAAAGRVMNATISANDPQAFLKEIFKQIPDVSSKQAADLVKIFTERPGDLNQALHALMVPKRWSQFMEAWKNGLVSGLGTQGANILGNTGEQVLRVGETAVASWLDRLGGGERTRLSGEARWEAEGLASGFHKSLGRLGKDLRDVLTLAPEKLDLGLHGEALERQIGAIPGKAGRAVRIPFRLLGAFDQFFKGVGGEGEVYKRAWREARGSEARAREIIKAYDDFMNGGEGDSLPKGFLDVIHKSREERTYQDPNTLALAGTRLRSSFPILHMVMPFLQTPANIARIAYQRSPAGFIDGYKAFAEYRKALGRESPAKIAELRGIAMDKLARPIVGTVLLGGFAVLAKNGGMTGSGPTDPKTRNALRETGWQPYSFVVTQRDGSKLYIPYARFEPVSTTLSLAADAIEAKDSKTAGDLATKALGSIVQNFTSKTYLQGIADAAEFVNDPMRAGGTYIRGLAGSLVPNIVAKGAQAIDPTLRDVKPSEPGIGGFLGSVGKQIQSRIPFASQRLPALHSGTGETIERPGNAFTRFASPVQPSVEKPGTQLERLLVDLDAVRSAPGSEMVIPGSHGKKVTLTQEERDFLSKADLGATRRLRQIIDDPRFTRMQPEEQKALVEKIYAQYRTHGRQELYKQPEFRRRARETMRGAA